MSDEMKCLYRALVKHLNFIEECIKCASRDDTVTFKSLLARRQEVEMIINYIKH